MSPLYWFILAYLVVGIIVAVWILQKDNKEQRVDLKGKLHALSANLMGPWRRSVISVTTIISIG